MPLAQPPGTAGTWLCGMACASPCASLGKSCKFCDRRPAICPANPAVRSRLPRRAAVVPVRPCSARRSNLGMVAGHLGPIDTTGRPPTDPAPANRFKSPDSSIPFHSFHSFHSLPFHSIPFHSFHLIHSFHSQRIGRRQRRKIGGRPTPSRQSSATGGSWADLVDPSPPPRSCCPATR